VPGYLRPPTRGKRRRNKLFDKRSNNFIGFAVNIVVSVTDDDKAENYKPVQRAFAISPDIDNQDPNRPGRSRVEAPDNPEKDNVTTRGNQLIWSDNPGIQVSGMPIANASGTIYSLFVSTVKPKDEKKGEGTATDKVLNWGVKVEVKDGKIVRAIATQITKEQYQGEYKKYAKQKSRDDYGGRP